MDLRKLKTLLQLMEEHGLSEMEIEEEGAKIRLRKPGSGSSTAPVYPATSVPAVPLTATVASVPARTGGGASTPERSTENLHEVKSPIVGTFYRSPSPASDPFVKPGQRVSKDAVLCIIEAMKVMNEIKSDVSGVVEEMPVENGQPVEYGQTLMRIRV